MTHNNVTNVSFNSFLRYVLSRRSETFFFIPLISPPGYKPTQKPLLKLYKPRALKWDFTVFNYCIVYFTHKLIFYKLIRMVFVFRKGNENFKAKCAFLLAHVEPGRGSVHIRSKTTGGPCNYFCFARRRFFPGTL